MSKRQARTGGNEAGCVILEMLGGLSEVLRIRLGRV